MNINCASCNEKKETALQKHIKTPAQNQKIKASNKLTRILWLSEDETIESTSLKYPLFVKDTVYFVNIEDLKNHTGKFRRQE